MESTSTQMNRLGKSLVTDTEILLARPGDRRDRRRRAPSGLRASPPSCSRRSGSRPPGSARARSGSSRPSSARRRRSRARHEDRPQRLATALARDGQGRRGARPGTRRGRARARRARRRRPRRWSTSPRRRVVVPNILRALAAGVPCVVGTTGWDTRRGRRRGARGRPAGLLRAELRDRRGADDALRRGGVAPPRRGRDHRAPPRDEARRTVRHRAGDRGERWRGTCRSTPSGSPASSPTRR